MGPYCTLCGLRPARPHHAVGFFKHCERCAAQRREAKARYEVRGRRTGKKCRAPGCDTPAPGIAGTTRQWCSSKCRREYQVTQQARNKTVVLAALGHTCGCLEVNCYHCGPCEVTLSDGLTVHHAHEDGAKIRRATRTGVSTSPRQSSSGVWSRYRRALAVPNHGMRLLCGTCHLVHSVRSSRARRLPVTHRVAVNE
jgi:hypothetical protein